MADENILYSTKAAADFMNVDRKTIQRYRKEGLLIPNAFGKNNSVFYSEEQLIALAKHLLTSGDKLLKFRPQVATSYENLIKNSSQVGTSSKKILEENSQVGTSSKNWEEIADIIQNGNIEIDRSIPQLTTVYSGSAIFRKKDKPSVAKYPKSLIIPTLPQFQNAMSLFQEGSAYLYPSVDTSNLKFERGKLFFAGSEPLRMITEVELQNFRTNESITEITGLPILRAYYSILLTTYEELLKNNEKLPKVLELYVPELAEYLGMERNSNEKTVHSIMSQFRSFDHVMGVMHVTRNGRPDKSYFPVLSFLGYDAKRNVIEISSPYLVHVIDNIFRAAIRLNRKQQPMLNKKGEPFRLPSQSYIINPNISRERNQTAVENVVIIVTTIEQAGNNTPHIKASTIIERNPQLQERIANTTENHRNRLLQRVFKKTWELLRDQTNLLTVYKDIRLPDPEDSKNIPTLKTLDIVFEFPHDGKITAVKKEKSSKIATGQAKSASKKNVKDG